MLFLALAAAGPLAAQQAPARCVVARPLTLLGGVVPVAEREVLLNFPVRRVVELRDLETGGTTQFGPKLRRGELQSVGASGVASGEVWVFDDRQSVLAFFARDGSPIRSVPLRPPLGMRFAAVLDDGRLLWLPRAGTYGRRARSAGTVAVITTADQQGADTILALERSMPRVLVTGPNGEIEVPNWIDDSPITVVSPRGRYLAVLTRRPARAAGRDSVRLKLVDLTFGSVEMRSFDYAVRQVPSDMLDSLAMAEASHLASHLGHGAPSADPRALARAVLDALPPTKGWRPIRSALVNDRGDVVLEREYTDSVAASMYQMWRRHDPEPVEAVMPVGLWIRAAGDGGAFAVSRDRDRAGACGLWVVDVRRQGGSVR